MVLPKLDKKNYFNSKFYRIIALFNCLDKALKRVIAMRLTFLPDRQDNLLYPNQIGGRK